MRKYTTIIFLLVFVFGNLFAQETEEQTPEEKDKPVRSPFESGYLIDNQTSFIPTAKTLEYVIQHKFGSIGNGKSDLWGIYAPGANIRIGLNYVVAKNMQIGWGIAKKNKYNDFNAKWTILEQTRKNTIPVAVTLYGNFAIVGRPLSAFESGKVQRAFQTDASYDYKFSDRISYFSQLIVGRKFCDRFTMQTAVSFTHFNSVAMGMDHDKIGLHLNGRIKVSPQGSVVFNYDAPLKIKSISEQVEWYNHPEPNLSFGYEISTSTHAFQIYMGNSDGIIPQEIMMNNLNKITKDSFAIGFTITRLWSF
ncbi:MAG TPA: hypothetical protein DIW50_10255 [Prolixibacteraceae bacterium]|nr:hypothetical protein [Prolixibacteraceae bacterium]